MKTIQTIADNLNPRFNNINPNDYSFQLLDSLLEFQIKNITSIVSYESRLISTTNNIPTITYTDLNVTLYIYIKLLIYNSIINTLADIYLYSVFI